MKTLFLVTVTLFCIGCHSEPAYNMEILYVDKYIMTPYSVNCLSFENTFGEDIKKIDSIDVSVAKKTWGLLDSLVASKGVRTSPDVRFKLKVWRNDELRVVCMDEVEMIFNGKMYKYEGEIKDVIESLIKGE